MRIMPNHPLAITASRTQLAFMDYWLTKIDEEWWEKFERVLGTRFSKEIIEEPKEALAADLLAGLDIRIPLALGVNPSLITIVREAFAGADKGSKVSEFMAKTLKDHGQDVGDLGKVKNLMDYSKEELFSRFPMLNVRGGPSKATPKAKR